MLTFYYTLRSPYARKVRILLAEMGTEHIAEAITPGSMESGSLFGEDYEYLVPSMRVPAIMDGDQVVFESNFLLSYLLQKYPAKGKPVGEPPIATSMIRASHEWHDNMVLVTIETLLNSALNVAQMKRFGVEADGVPYLRRELARCQSCLDWLEARAMPEGFAPGVFSIADINLLCALQWFDDKDVIPWWGRSRLESIVARYQDRPSVKDNPLVY